MKQGRALHRVELLVDLLVDLVVFAALPARDIPPCHLFSLFATCHDTYWFMKNCGSACGMVVLYICASQ